MPKLSGGPHPVGYPMVVFMYLGVTDVIWSGVAVTVTVTTLGEHVDSGAVLVVGLSP